jgi:hypothetical protein
MIAKQFGITHTQLNRIRSGENWSTLNWMMRNKKRSELSSDLFLFLWILPTEFIDSKVR